MHISNGEQSISVFLSSHAYSNIFYFLAKVSNFQFDYEKFVEKNTSTSNINYPLSLVSYFQGGKVFCEELCASFVVVVLKLKHKKKHIKIIFHAVECTHSISCMM